MGTLACAVLLSACSNYVADFDCSGSGATFIQDQGFRSFSIRSSGSTQSGRTVRLTYLDAIPLLVDRDTATVDGPPVFAPLEAASVVLSYEPVPISPGRTRWDGSTPTLQNFGYRLLPLAAPETARAARWADFSVQADSRVKADTLALAALRARPGDPLTPGVAWGAQLLVRPEWGGLSVTYFDPYGLTRADLTIGAWTQGLPGSRFAMLGPWYTYTIHVPSDVMDPFGPDLAILNVQRQASPAMTCSATLRIQ